MKIATIPGTHSKAQQRANDIVAMLKQTVPYGAFGTVVDWEQEHMQVVVGAIDSDIHLMIVVSIEAYIYAKRWRGVRVCGVDNCWRNV